MGGEESKFCASKNNASKKCIVKLLKLGLRREEADHFLKLLGGQRVVPKEKIEAQWHNLLTTQMMETYCEYLMQKTDSKFGESTVDIFAFCLFLTNFIRGSVEDRLHMYSSFLQISDGDSIPVSAVEKYVIQLMNSVLKLMETKDIIQYHQWNERGHSFDDDDMQLWACATIANVCEFADVDSLTADQMSSWLTLNTDVVLLQCYLFYSLYELDKFEINKNGEQKSTHCPLPYLEVNVARKDWRVIINIPSSIFINSHLPAENRYRWRLIYSADINGVGFSTFYSLICNKGPTVLVIKDKENHIFGGYASTDWHVGPKFFGDQRCFLFSLKPVMKVYPTLPHNDHFLYLNANQKSLPNGLGMGGQLGYWGLWIDAGFEFGSCSPTCSTYAGYKMLSGSPQFGIAGVEVWSAEGIYNSDENGSTVNSEHEESSILHKDPGARALMDMLGKSGSGRDFLNHHG